MQNGTNWSNLLESQNDCAKYSSLSKIFPRHSVTILRFLLWILLVLLLPLLLWLAVVSFYASSIFFFRLSLLLLVRIASILYCAVSARWIEPERRICQPNISKLYVYFVYFFFFSRFVRLAYVCIRCECVVRFHAVSYECVCVCSFWRDTDTTLWLRYVIILYNNNNDNNKNNIIWFVFHSLLVRSLFTRALVRFVLEMRVDLIQRG